ncbi:MAG: LPS export ABC transporter permease LptG [Proteobacteria bacterium]|nr:LPS export ABC transporter permease LptG [Pseudomonadota bacterium]
MKILFKYISLNFFKLFLTCIMSFLVIYLTIDFMSKFWKLSEREVPFIDICRYFLYKTPLILTQITPMATLLATLLTLGILSRNNEVTVMKACGISLFQISSPILLISLFISLFSLFTSEYLLPHATQKYKEIERYRPGGSKYRLFKQSNIWYFGQGIIYQINHLDLVNGVMNGVTILRVDRDYKIVERIDSRQAKLENGLLTLTNGITRSFHDSLKYEQFKEKMLPTQEKFSDFTVSEPMPEEMTFKKLNKYIERLKKMGLDYTSYVVDLLAKIAFPLANFILPLIGIPFALKTGRSSGIAAGVGISIIIGFTYWITMAFNISLGHVGVLPPFLAAFGSNIIFALIGVVSIMSVKT